MRIEIVRSGWLAQSNIMLAIMAALLMSGCGAGDDGRDGRADAGGVVTLDGSPLEGATVSLVPQGDTPSAVAKTDANGEFTFTTHTPNDGAIPGQYKVTVSKVEMSGGVSEDEANELMAAGKPVPSPTRKELVPAKYTKANSTDIEVTINEGEGNHIEIPLD